MALDEEGFVANEGDALAVGGLAALQAVGDVLEVRPSSAQDNDVAEGARAPGEGWDEEGRREFDRGG
jgi:hypothetical protein